MSASTPANLPTPPFIHAPGVANLRDMGGYGIATTDGSKPTKVIRRGILYRSADPSKATDEGIEVLRQLGIRTVYDLRSATEIGVGKPADQLQVKEWDGAKRAFVPVFQEWDYSPAALAVRFKDYMEGSEGFVRAYSSILTAASDPAHPSQPYASILKHLAGTPTDHSSAGPDGSPTPMLVHCTAGKDRTGVICALVLSLCGVDDDTVSHEYSLTDLGLAGRRSDLVEHVIKAFGATERAAAERMVSARRENMEATLKMIRQTFGSVDEYVTKNCGLTAGEVEKIKKNLVVHLAPGEEPIDWKPHADLLVQSLETEVAASM